MVDEDDWASFPARKKGASIPNDDSIVWTNDDGDDLADAGTAYDDPPGTPSKERPTASSQIVPCLTAAVLILLPVLMYMHFHNADTTPPNLPSTAPRLPPTNTVPRLPPTNTVPPVYGSNNPQFPPDSASPPRVPSSLPTDQRPAGFEDGWVESSATATPPPTTQTTQPATERTASHMDGVAAGTGGTTPTAGTVETVRKDVLRELLWADKTAIDSMLQQGGPKAVYHKAMKLFKLMTAMKHSGHDTTESSETAQRALGWFLGASEAGELLYCFLDLSTQCALTVHHTLA